MLGSSGSSISDACHAHIRDVLLGKLIENAKQCKALCGSKVADEEDGYMVSAIESVLFHGLRRHRVDVPVLKEFTGLMNKFTSLDLGVSAYDDEFWTAIRSVLKEHEVRLLESLNQITGAMGRIRAWLRLALNENTFGRFVAILLEEPALLEKSHEEWAFLRNNDKLTAFSQIIKEFNGVHFSLRIDSPHLNRPFATEFDDLSSLSFDGVKKAPCPVMVVNGNGAEVRCKRRPQISFVSFDSSGICDSDVQSSIGYKTAFSNSNSRTASESGRESSSFEDATEVVENGDPRFSPVGRGSFADTLNSLVSDLATLRLEFDELRSGYADFKCSSALELERLFSLSKQIVFEETSSGSYSAHSAPKDLAVIEEVESSAKGDDKFQQLATMYSEVMEMNNMLLSQIARQNSAIRCLQQELQRVQFGQDQQNSTDMASEPVFSGSSAAFVLVWIPTAFVTGKGAGVHHVYQTYIKTGSGEFTVYRRYSEFWSLRKAMASRDDRILRLPFPGKRKFFHMNEKFVELRRHQLEAFLRELLNYMIMYFPELSVGTFSRQSLISLSPFFK